MINPFHASQGASAFASRTRRRRASTLRPAIAPCLEQLEGRTLLSALPTQADPLPEPLFPTLSAAQTTSDLHLVISGEGCIVQDTPYTLNLSATGSSANTITSWTINWGDGTTETLDGNPPSASHTYTTTGNFTISASATDADGLHQAASAQLNTPALVGTVSFPSMVFEHNGMKYFTSGSNTALWRTDGTAAGTTLVKTLCEHADMYASSTAKFFSLGDRFLFAVNYAFDTIKTLWTSDGTVEGTQLLDYIGSASFNPMRVGNKVLYESSDGVHTTLKQTDGITVSSPDVPVTPGCVVSNNTLYYARRAGNGTTELWKSDGTPQGTLLLKGDLPRGQLGDFIEVAGKTYFIYTPTNDYGGLLDGQLWTTDGTPQGTTPVSVGSGAGSVTQLLSVNGSLLCIFDPSNAHPQLWKSDGTANGTSLLKDNCGYPPLVGTLDGVVLFKSCDAEHGTELWSSDGTLAGTRLLKDLSVGIDSSWISDCVRIGDNLYFMAAKSNSIASARLWKTDGTEAGTISIAEIPSSFQNMQGSNGTLVIHANESLYAYKAWETDGIVRLTDPRAIQVDDTSHLSTASEMLFFTATNLTSNTTQLWRLGGDEAQMVRVLTAVGTSDIGQLTDEGAVYTLRLAYNGVAADSIHSWIVRWGDGMVETIVGHPSSITHTYADDGAYTIIASATDGTQTYAAPDTIATIRNVLPSLTLGGEERVLFGSPYELSLAASDPGDDHIRSWTIDWGDGSIETMEGNPSSARHTYTVKGNYTITASVTDEDGASSKLYGASPADSYPWNDPADAHEFTSPGGMHYYCKESEESDPVLSIGPGQEWELWRDDGNGGEPIMLHSFYAYDLFYSLGGSDPLPLDRAPSHFTCVGDTVFFRAYDRYCGSELWATSDTATGAWLITDLCPGEHAIRATGQVLGYEPNGSGPDDFFEHDGKLYFLASDGNQRTLWKTDGQNVTKADDIVTKLGANPTSAIVFNNLLILTTRDEQRRLEFYQMDPSGVVTPLLATHPAWINGYDPKLVDGRICFTAEDPVGSYNYRPWVITAGPVHLAVGDPTLTITMSGSGAIVNGSTYTLNLGYANLDPSSIQSVTIDWGDGNTETLPGNPSSASHTYTTTGNFIISASATDADGIHQAVSPQPNTPVLVGTFTNPSMVFEYKGLKYFTADYASTAALWRTDGTAAGTHLVKTLEPEYQFLPPFDSSKTKFYNLGDCMVLLTMPKIDPTDPMRPRQTTIWASDGTGAGTTALDRFEQEIPSVVVLGNRAIYTADGCNKVTDGVTTASADFFPGPGDLAVYGRVVNNIVYCTFWVTDKVELWKSDGTPDGTMLLKGNMPRGQLGDFIEVAGKTYFVYTPTNDYGGLLDGQLWTTDGTPEGTHQLVTSSRSGSVVQLLSVNGALLCVFRPRSGITELLKTDGTTQGTTLLKDRLSNSDLDHLMVYGESVFFWATDDEHGTEIWKSDGTLAGTQLLKDLTPGIEGTYVNEATCIGDTMYFSSRPARSGSGETVWKTDGTAAGTISIPCMPRASTQGMQNSSGTLVFATTDAIYAYQDWKGETLVRLTDPTLNITSESRLFTAGNMLFFTAKDATGTELWCSGGDGEQKVRVVSAVGISDLGQPTNEGYAYTLLLSYNAVDASSIRSWTIDWGDGHTETIEGHPSSTTHTYADDGAYTVTASAADGTQTYAAPDTIAIIHNVLPTLSLSGKDKVALGSPYVLNLKARDFGQDTITSWTIDWGDGSVETIQGNPSSARHTYTAKGDYTISASATDEDGISSRFYYDADHVPSIPTDDSANVHEFTSPSGARYYCQVSGPDPLNPGTEGRMWELWRDDGTGSGPIKLHSFQAYELTLYSQQLPLERAPSQFTCVGDTIYFVAYDYDYGFELWATSDTATSARLVKDACPGTREVWQMGMHIGDEPNSSAPHDLVSYNDKLYFIASDGIRRHLWQTDGQTVTKADDIINQLGAAPTNVLILDGLLLLTTQDDEGSPKFYQMDHAGTVTTMPIGLSIWGAPLETDMIVVDGQVYFKAFERMSTM
ncbi:MAG TPA: PKD domain-containing protein, partial [Chloroflexota bacterium]|nr:PKD domain-containing protein [Chloroflexota bacterium]